MTTGNTNEQELQAADRAARIIAQALIEAEVIIAAERDTRAQTVPPAVIETLERFSGILSKLVDHNEQLAARVADLTRAVESLAEVRSGPVLGGGAKPQLPDMEPSFAPGGEGVDVTVSAVPGFQGLMEVQRALVRLAGVQSAAVRRYQDDEAAIQLVLSQPMSASAIAEGISTATGSQLIVDESRPESLRLRLRFL